MDSLLVTSSGALATTPGGGSLLAVAGGSAPCCCGGACEAYFRAHACGTSNPCPRQPVDIFVCASAWQASCPGLPVVALGGFCYRVQDEGNPIPVGDLPPGAFTYDGPFNCLPDCTHGCSLPAGYYQIRFCACEDRHPGQTFVDAVVSCDCEWANRAAGMRCPTYLVVSPNGTLFCVQADLFAPPVTPNPGTQILCTPAGDGCCACCNGFNYGGCGNYVCGPFFQRFPGNVVYGRPRPGCCGERWSRVGTARYRRLLGNFPFPDCLVEEIAYRWAIDSDDTQSWIVYREVTQRGWDAQGRCVVVNHFNDSYGVIPACDTVPTRTVPPFQNSGTQQLVCLDDGWQYDGSSSSGSSPGSGGVTFDDVHERFTVTLGVCGGPCERGDRTPFVRRGGEWPIVAKATISPLPPLPLLGGLL